MIKKIKKHKNKLFILMLTLISALTLFLNVGKTYAYETFDNFSETLQLDTTNLGTNVNSITYNSTDKYYAINVTIPSDYSNVILYFTPNDALQYTNWSYYSLLFNGIIYDSTNTNRIAYNSSRYINVGFGSDNTYIGYTSSWYFNTQLLIDNKYFSICICPNVYNGSWYVNDAEKNRINMNFSFSGTYTIRLYNCDFFTRGDLTYKYIYDKYYGNIAEQYEQLQTNYETLQDDYTTLEGNYNDLQDNYDELETNYNTLQENYDNLEDKTNYGIFGYLLDANFQYKLPNTPFVTINDKTSFNLTELQDLGIITSGGNYNATYFETNYNPNYEAVIGNFYFNNSLPLTLIDLSFSDFEGALVEIVDSNGGIARFDISSEIQNINYNNILENYASFSNFVDEIHITPNNAEIMGTMYTSSSYNVGYLYGTHAGFQLGYDYAQNTINDLNSQINSLNSQITDLQNTISLVQSSNEQLRNELSTLNENNMTWQKMFFTMADTPLKTVASVLGKDSGNAFLGINLYQTFIGLLTTLAIIWLIKRIL